MFKLSNILEYLPEFKKEVYRKVDRKRYFSNTRPTKSNLLTVLVLVNDNPELLDTMDYTRDELDQLKKYFGSLTKGEMKVLMHNLWDQNMINSRLDGFAGVNRDEQNLQDEIGATPANQVQQLPVEQRIQQVLQSPSVQQLPQNSQQRIQQILQEPMWMQDLQAQQIYQQLPVGAVNIEVDFEEGTNIAHVSTTFRGEKISLKGNVTWNEATDSWEFTPSNHDSRRQQEFYTKYMVEIDKKIDMMYVGEIDDVIGSVSDVDVWELESLTTSVMTDTYIITYKNGKTGLYEHNKEQVIEGYGVGNSDIASVCAVEVFTMWNDEIYEDEVFQEFISSYFPVTQKHIELFDNFNIPATLDNEFVESFIDYFKTAGMTPFSWFNEETVNKLFATIEEDVDGELIDSNDEDMVPFEAGMEIEPNTSYTMMDVDYDEDPTDCYFEFEDNTDTSGGSIDLNIEVSFVYNEGMDRIETTYDISENSFNFTDTESGRLSEWFPGDEFMDIADALKEYVENTYDVSGWVDSMEDDEDEEYYDYDIDYNTGEVTVDTGDYNIEIDDIGSESFPNDAYFYDESIDETNGDFEKFDAETFEKIKRTFLKAYKDYLSKTSGL